MLWAAAAARNEAVQFEADLCWPGDGDTAVEAKDAGVAAEDTAVEAEDIAVAADDTAVAAETIG